ncbi:MAG: hypothetical protein ACKVXR_17025 [Planctomycetota bacterium]
MPRELERYEENLARVLLAEDPWKELQAAIADPATPASVRESLGQVDEDGLRISGLLVAKLRFERLMNGSRHAAEWFERDPGEFTETFRRYHAAVAPTEVFPSREARQFEAWVATP